ncbi:hypothetical protein L1049_015763 [Liquidambar formosana]|uniref:Small auxin up regulated protein n=1 Tax=Liquidambar formosana TaxID=63359 RepID=A0AAP0X6B7_LIQFO
MINPKKLIKMARKWQKLAAIRRKRISLPKTAESCNTSSMADKGQFVVYTADQRRFMTPLVYLSNDIFQELFKMAEEEFGLPSNRPITLPCDSVMMEYVVSLIKRHVAKDLENCNSDVHSYKLLLIIIFISPSTSTQQTIANLRLLRQIRL